MTKSGYRSKRSNWYYIHYTWATDRDADIAIDTGKHRVIINIPGAIKIEMQGARAKIETAPTGATIIVDIHKNGTTIYTTQANRPTIPISGNDSGSPATPDVQTLTNGDYLTMDIDQVGSGTAGKNLTIDLEVKVWE